MALDGHSWPGKLGDLQKHFPGWSPHTAPSDLSVRPFHTVLDGVNIQLTPVIDAESNIWICGTFRNAFPGVLKVNSRGAEIFRIRIEDQIVATPALGQEAIYIAVDHGVASAYDIGTGRELWSSKYAPGSGNDPWSVGLCQDFLVMAGKSNEAMPWNDSAYGLSAARGDALWRFQATLLMFFTPNVLPGAVIFQDMQCTVTCLKLSDGSTTWQHKPKGHARSTGQVAVAQSLNMVFAAANRQSKKEWNAPYGGQGCIRAFDLSTGQQLWQQDFDLEANTAPSVSPSGPRGAATVVAALGASPGLPFKETATGDLWHSRLAALDAKSGEVLWTHDFDPWKGYGVRAAGPATIYQPTALTNPVLGGDGTLYVGWCGGWIAALRAADGSVASGYDLGVAPSASPVLAEGLLVMASYQRVHIWRAWEDWKQVLPGAQLALAGSEHFCACRGGDAFLEESPFRAPEDLSVPAWSHEMTEREPNEFLEGSPVVDSWGKIYVSSRTVLKVLNPDGTRQASLWLGSGLSTPALLGDLLFVGTADGFALAVELESLEVRWTRKYCVQASAGGRPLVATEGAVLVPGNTAEIRNENKTMFCLNPVDGVTRWSVDVKGSGVLNSRPVVIDDFVVFADVDGGVYAVHLEDGTLLWSTDKDSSHYHFGCHVCSGPMDKAQVYTTGVVRGEFKWNGTRGGRSLLRCLDAGSGCKRWEQFYSEEECVVPPVIIPKRRPLMKALVVVALGSAPGAPARPTEKGPDGSSCMGDCWSGRLLALDCENGQVQWTRSMPRLRSNSAPGNCSDDWLQAPAFSSPVVGNDGTLYVAWCSGLFMAFEGCTGKLLSQYDMGCAASGSPAVAPGMICIMSAFRLLTWRSPALEEGWRAVAATEEDPRALAAPLVARQDLPPEATWGLLRNVAPHCFSSESLHSFQWAQQFLAAEPRRREAAATVVKREQAEAHRKDGGPLAQSKKEALARLEAGGKGVAPKVKDVVPAAPAKEVPPPSKPKEAPPAQPSWLQALSMASLLDEDEEDDAPPEPPQPKPKAQPKAAPRRQCWEVIGGAGKGGIVVRKGQDVNSPQLTARLATGAIVEEELVSGDRLRFKKLKGDGPETGWVSLSFQGKPLLKRV